MEGECSKYRLSGSPIAQAGLGRGAPGATLGLSAVRAPPAPGLRSGIPGSTGGRFGNAGSGMPAALPGAPASYIEPGLLEELSSCIFTGNCE